MAECNDIVIITHEMKLKYSLAHFFKAKCCSEICDWSDSLLTPHSVDSKLNHKTQNVFICFLRYSVKLLLCVSPSV